MGATRQIVYGDSITSYAGCELTSMPSSKAVNRKQKRSKHKDPELEENSEVQSEDERSDGSRATPQDDDDDDDEGEEAAKHSQRGPSKLEKKRWRRLAIEEQEALVNEGGLVWKAAQPLMAELPSKSKKEFSSLLTAALRNAELKLNETLVPPTVRMPYASRNVGLGAASMASATCGTITGSVMSWQVEKGLKLLGEEESEERDEVALLELGGFSSDIAVLESLLLPEATETVSMTQAIDEQERELEVSKEQLIRLKADRESKKREGEDTASEVSSWIVLNCNPCAAMTNLR
jgi:hypothetical protein